MARWEGEKPGVARQVEALKGRVAELKTGACRAAWSRSSSASSTAIPAARLAPVRPIERPGQKQREWHCSACNYRVRPQVVVEIRNGDTLVQCDSCKRILFFAEEEPA